LSLLGAATTPRPPLLDAGAGDDERVLRLADAYRGACRARYACDAWGLKAANLKRSKFRAAMLESAAILVDAEIAPAAWAAWSFDRWRALEPANARRPPPVPWVWSPKRLAEGRGWFESERVGYSGGVDVPVREVVQLRERYVAMRRALAAEGTWASPKGVVDRFFPGDAFAEAVASARAAVARTNAELRSRAARGEWFW
jgi:hypothetical protein